MERFLNDMERGEVFVNGQCWCMMAGAHLLSAPIKSCTGDDFKRSANKWLRRRRREEKRQAAEKELVLTGLSGLFERKPN